MYRIGKAGGLSHIVERGIGVDQQPARAECVRRAASDRVPSRLKP
jgi:hypothetical protein